MTMAIYETTMAAATAVYIYIRRTGIDKYMEKLARLIREKLELDEILNIALKSEQRIVMEIV